MDIAMRSVFMGYLRDISEMLERILVTKEKKFASV